ncbi:MAG TPA: alpha/beta hydrolase [Rhizomicrobium sp.]
MTGYSTAGFTRDEHVVDGVRSVVYSAGKGPPVVFFHGGGTFHGFEWARDWLDRFRVVLPHHPGFGESQDDDDITGMADYVVHYTALFTALGLTRFGLSGASLGGRLATEFALTQGGMVNRLALAAPAGLLAPECPPPNWPAIPPQDVPKLLVADPAVIARWWPQDADDTFLAERARERVATGRVLADMEAADRKLRRRLPRLAVPTLVLWGGKDRILLPGLARHWAAAIPGATVVTIDEAGHLLLDESPRARRIAADFLAGAGV